MIEIFIILLFSVIFSLFFYKLKRKTFPLKIPQLKGRKLIYCDTNNASIFRNKKHKIAAKPDFIVLDDNNNKIIVEFKSRNKGIYSSDINQLKASVIAVRDKYPNITIGYIINGSGEYKKIELNKSTDSIALEIKSLLNKIRLLKNGNQIQHIPEKHKCMRCGFNENCNYSVI